MTEAFGTAAGGTGRSDDPRVLEVQGYFGPTPRKPPGGSSTRRNTAGPPTARLSWGRNVGVDYVDAVFSSISHRRLIGFTHC
jgi:hypothetical protein